MIDFSLMIPRYHFFQSYHPTQQLAPLLIPFPPNSFFPPICDSSSCVWSFNGFLPPLISDCIVKTRTWGRTWSKPLQGQWKSFDSSWPWKRSCTPYTLFYRVEEMLTGRNQHFEMWIIFKGTAFLLEDYDDTVEADDWCNVQWETTAHL